MLFSTRKRIDLIREISSSLLFFCRYPFTESRVIPHCRNENREYNKKLHKLSSFHVDSINFFLIVERMDMILPSYHPTILPSSHPLVAKTIRLLFTDRAFYFKYITGASLRPSCMDDIQMSAATCCELKTIFVHRKGFVRSFLTRK